MIGKKKIIAKVARTVLVICRSVRGKTKKNQPNKQTNKNQGM